MQFNFFAPAYLVKSGDSKQNGIVKVGGRITTDDFDLDNEKLLTEGLDFSIFTGGFGKIKYEHDGGMYKEPDNIIGFPIKLIKGKNHAEFEGELINFSNVPEDQLTIQQKAAKGAYGLLLAIDDHNKRNPSKPQKAGWSIEGEYIEKDPKTGIVKKARITNVVLTTKPKNTHTFAQIMKSLSVGYETDVTNKIGYGATRTESIDRDFKTQKERSTMTKNEYIQDCIKKGMSEEEAKKEAEKKYKESDSEKEKGNHSEPDNDNLDLKDVMDDMEEVSKSLNTITRYNPSKDPKDFREDFKKSVSVAENIDDVNLLSYFEGQHDATVTGLDNDILLNHKINVIAKSLATMAKSISHIASQGTSLNKSVENQNKATAVLLKSQNRSGIISTDLLKSIGIDDIAGKDENHSNTPIRISEITNSIESLRDAGKIEKSMANRMIVQAESCSGYIEPSMEKIVKSHALSLRK